MGAQNAEKDTKIPVFIRKSYQMIDTCPPHIGGWSVSGDTFLVRDEDSFAHSIIPTFFRHNNFSSFVRQLNFYGFRKIKSDTHGLRRNQGVNGQRIWEFHHDCFKRGAPHLMENIGRRKDASSHAAESSSEVQSLRREVSSLKSCLSAMERRIAQMELAMVMSRSPEGAKAAAGGRAPQMATNAREGQQALAPVAVPDMVPRLRLKRSGDGAAPPGAAKRRCVAPGRREAGGAALAPVQALPAASDLQIAPLPLAMLQRAASCEVASEVAEDLYTPPPPPPPLCAQSSVEFLRQIFGGDAAAMAPVPLSRSPSDIVPDDDAALVNTALLNDSELLLAAN